jgi:hypothetical protein
VSPAATTQSLQATFQPDWHPGPGDPGRRGFLSPDPRVRTLLRVLVSYPEVRHVLPDRVSLEPGADVRLIESMMRFVSRQAWLVTRVTLAESR